MDNILYQNKLIKIEIEPHEVPWLKIFTQEEIKEFSQCDGEIKLAILDALDIIEKEMLEYFKPTKINIASFGNYMPWVHFHIQARFEDDSFFPEPTWGDKQRDEKKDIRDKIIFYDNLKLKLSLI